MSQEVGTVCAALAVPIEVRVQREKFARLARGASEEILRILEGGVYQSISRSLHVPDLVYTQAQKKQIGASI